MPFFRKNKPSSAPSPRRAAVALVLFAVVIVGATALAWHQRQFGTATVRIGGDIIVRADVAETWETWERGLSGRSSLGAEEGLLFLFPSASRYAFWMKDMLFPIDIIWIRDGVLEDITTDVPVPPPGGGELIRYFPAVPADTVLEVPAGFAARHGLRTGMPVTIER